MRDLGAGPIQNTQITRGFVRQDDFILCADGGYAHARRMGLRPDLLIGDFDSVKPPEHAGCEVYSYPPEKDDTDMLLALKCGLERGFRDYLILGGLGGRLDHTIANFTVLAYAIDHGAKAVLQDEKNAAILLRDSAISVPVCPGFKLSVFPYGGGAKGVCLRGVKYPWRIMKWTHIVRWGSAMKFFLPVVKYLSKAVHCCLFFERLSF